MEHSYKFLASTGELEIKTRAGYKLLSGCSCRGIFEFQDRLNELQQLLPELGEEDSSKPLEALYLSHERFRFLCDRIFTLNGIELDWVRPRDVEWLIFGHLDESGNPHPSPLQLLNAAREPRYPRKPGGEGKGDFAALLAAIATRCSGFGEAFEVATSEPARIVLAALEDMSWHSMTAEDQDDTKFKAWAEEQKQKATQTENLGGWGRGH